MNNICMKLCIWKKNNGNFRIVIFIKLIRIMINSYFVWMIWLTHWWKKTIRRILIIQKDKDGKKKERKEENTLGLCSIQYIQDVS